jgi:class 3 adenylate cyclase
VTTSTLVLVIGLAVLAAAGLAGTATLAVLLGRQRRRTALLERELTDRSGRGRSRRLLSPPRVPTTREAVKAVWETAALVREKGVGGALRSSVEDLAGWAQVERPDLARLAAGDGSVTILFSDIEGSTALNEELGDKAWVKLLARHDAVVRRCVAAYDGHVVKTQGDGFMVAFGPADHAVDCAVDIQRALTKRRLRPLDPDIRVRIGIHRGEAVRRDNDLFGRNVAYAARVAGHADGGEILVSDPVAAALGDDLPVAGTREAELKGLAGVHRLHVVAWQDDAALVDADQGLADAD